MSATAARPTTIDEVREAVLAAPRVLARGAGSKPALARHDDDCVAIDLRGVRGVTDYQPSEFTVTVAAGTPLAEVAAALAAHGQYLPFDPPRVEAGATVGGTVAAGLSGSGRYRYGGVRDFLLGVVLVDGEGRLVHGGGKVVKNAAGFDLPKLMVGSAGRLGVLVELTFKVFPRPPAWSTLRLDFGSRDAALEAVIAASRVDWGLEALDLHAPATLWLRLAGDRDGLAPRAERLRAALAGVVDSESFDAERDAAVWRRAGAFAWAGGRPLVKVPTTPRRYAALDDALPGAEQVPRRTCAAANLTWLAWPPEAGHDTLDAVLRHQGLAGLALDRRPWRLGADNARPFVERVKRALDPERRFPEL